MSPNLWRVQKGPKVRRPFSYFPSEPNPSCRAHPKDFTKKNKDILETEVEDAKSRHVAFVQLPEARWSTAVCQTGIEKEWKKPKLLCAIVSSPPIGARLPLAARFVGFITWICSIRCLHCYSSCCMNLSAEKVSPKKRKTGFIIKTESRPQATPFDECQPNCIKICKKCNNPLPLQCKHTEAKERLFNWTITKDQQGLIDDFRILRASGTEALNSEV